MAELFDMDTDAFMATLDELGIKGEERDWYLREYREKSSPFSGMYGAIDDANTALEDKDMRRLNLLPLAVPKGKSGLDSIREGSWEFALPGMATGTVETVAKAVDAPGAVAKGAIPEKDMTQEALGVATTFTGAGLSTGKYDPGVLNIFGGYKAAKRPGVDSAGTPLPTSVGKDTLPRFEIDDSKSFINNNVLNATSVKNWKRVPTNATTLGDMFNHDELYAQYPELKDVKFVIDDSLGHNEYGWAYTDESIGVNRQLLKDPDKLMGTLIHEIQHIVQEKEGFTIGTEPNAPETRQIAYTEWKSPENYQAWKEYDANVAARESAANAKRYIEALDKTPAVIAKHFGMSEKEFMSFNNPTAWGRLKMKFSKSSNDDKRAVALLATKLNDLRKAAVPSYNSTVSKFKQAFDSILFESEQRGFYDEVIDSLSPEFRDAYVNAEAKYSKSKWDAAIASFDPEPKLPYAPDPRKSLANAAGPYLHKMYERKAGEAEARNAAARLAMELSERFGTSPESTEDIARQYQWNTATDKPDLPEFADGGVVTKGTQMNNLLETGGLNASSASVDPISGNEVPVGSTPKEVRDDIDAKLSENEYVVPADVVKFYGVHFFEKLRKKAKEGLAEMDAEGRIGGGKVEDEEGEMEDDDLPFDISELETIGGDDEPAFADGGVVTGPTAQQTAQWQSSWNPQNFQYGFSTTPQGSQLSQPQQQAAPQAQQTTTKTYVNASGRTIVITFDANGNPTTPIPEGFYELGTTPPRQQATEDRDPQEAYQRPDVSTYEIEDFQDVLDQADFTRGLARAAGVAAPPLGAAIQSGYNRTVQDSYAEINRRLEAGGLTPEQQAELESLRDKFKDAGGTTEPTGISRVTNGLSGVFSGIIDAVTGRNTAQPSGREVEPGFYQQTQDDRDYTTTGGVRYTSTGPGSYQATGSTAPSSSPVPQSRPASVRSSTSDNSSTVSATEAQQAARDFAEQNNTGLYGGGRAKGGLVTRKTKLKPSTPRKKVKVVEK